MKKKRKELFKEAFEKGLRMIHNLEHIHLSAVVRYKNIFYKEFRDFPKSSALLDELLYLKIQQLTRD